VKYIKMFESYEKLSDACREGDLNVVIEFIENKKVDVNNINKYGYSSLILAADNNRIDIVKYLIEKGADVNYQDAYERTALHYAAMRKNINIIKILIEAGSNWNLKDDNDEDFLFYIKNTKVYMDMIMSEYTEQYEKYLSIKNSEKFNL